MKFLLLTSFLLVSCILWAGNDKLNCNAVLLSYNRHVDVLKNKKVTTNHVKLMINNRLGEAYSYIRIPYSKSNKIVINKAILKDLTGNVIAKFSKRDFYTKSNISDYSFYEDDYVKICPVKHNIYPYVVEYEYEEHAKQFVYIASWFPMLDDHIPTISAKLSIRMPADYPFHYKTNGIKDTIYSINKLEKTIRWKTSFTTVSSEYFSPHHTYSAPFVQVVPDNFKYVVKGSFASWKSFGIWQTQVMEGLDDLTAEEKVKVNDLIKGIDDKRKIAKKLYHELLQKKRYVNISMATGGLQPHSASYVCQNGYGDCKALSNYFKSVLNHVGIKSYYTKVYSGHPIRYVDTSFVSQQSNHIILMVPMKSDTVWLDCTSGGPFNYLGTSTQNRLAFVVDGPNSHFVSTPKMKPEDLLMSRNISVKTIGNLIKADITERYRGRQFESLNYLKNANSKDDVKQIITENIADEGFLLDEYTFLPEVPGLNETGIQYSSSSKKSIIVSKDELLLKQFKIYVPEIEEPEERKLPVQIDYYIHRIDTVDYLIPDGYVAQVNDETFEIATSFGIYKYSCKPCDQAISLVRKLLVNPGFYGLDQYHSFYKFIDDIHTFENNKFLVFKKAL